MDEQLNKKPYKSFVLGFVSGIILVCIGLLISFIFIMRGNSNDSALLNDKTQIKLKLMEMVIEDKYLGKVDNNDLRDGIYHGIVSGLDDKYSCYYNSEETKTILEDTSGNYSGVGLYLSINDLGLAYVDGVIPNSPAAKTGIAKGDIIVKLDNKDISEKTLDEIISIVKGKSGTDITITVRRDDKELSYTITRENIDIPSVESQVINNNKTGYIKISSFSENTPKDFKSALNQTKNKQVSSLVIDLRDNPGGELNSVIDVLDELLPKGIIFYSKDNKNKKQEYKTKGNDTLDIPLYVLVNQNSASASEIFAGAIRDRKIGTLVGTKTYGKGVINEIVSLGDDTSIRLTIAKYYTPNGEDINLKGITPQIEVKDDSSTDTDEQLEKALEIINTAS